MAITKYMNTSNDTTVTKFLQQAEDDIAVTKYLVDLLLENALGSASGVDQYLDTTVTKFMDQQQDDIAITKYLGSTGSQFLEQAAKDAAISQYLNGPDMNDISVTKFMDQ